MTTPPAEVSAPALTVSHTSTVTPDQIDDLGHMNVRHYGANAYAATIALCAEQGLGEPQLRSAYTRHHHEQMEGNELEVRSAFLAPDPEQPRLRFYHELRNRENDDLAATFIHELNNGAIEQPTIELPPYGAPRSLRLDVDRFASAPSIDELRERGLAIRLPRTVDTEDTMGRDTVPPWLANNLIWNGERPDEETDWIHTLPSGDRYSYVVMEARLWVPVEPVAVGTPIESFSANVEIAEKITREVNWSYNSESGEPLAIIESIDLCFNMTQRKSMLIPDESRARFEPHLFPEYGQH